MKRIFKSDGKAFQIDDTGGQFRMEIPEAEALVDSGEAILYDTHDELNESIQYKMNRKNAYPAIQDQLDYIYHNSITKWKSDMIKPVKDAHPKP